MSTRQICRKSIANRFSAAAETYNRHAEAQTKAAAVLMKLIGCNQTTGSILEIGCGTGILTERLAAFFPAARIYATDISSGMTSKSKERLSHYKNIKWLTGDFLELSLQGRHDLVTSSSSLQWITPLRATFLKAAASLKNDGRLAFSMMLKGTLAELHTARRKVAPAKKVNLQLPAEKEVLGLLESAGLRLTAKHRSTHRQAFKSCSHFLKSLHEQGVTGGPFASPGCSLMRGELERLVSWYDKHYKLGHGRNGVFATYKILWVVAEKDKKWKKESL